MAKFHLQKVQKWITAVHQIIYLNKGMMELKTSTNKLENNTRVQTEQSSL